MSSPTVRWMRRLRSKMTVPSFTSMGWPGGGALRTGAEGGWGGAGGVEGVTNGPPLSAASVRPTALGAAERASPHAEQACTGAP